MKKPIKSGTYEVKICTYCDQRVAPDGVRGVRERLEEVKTRYKSKPNSVWSNEEKAEHLIECACGIEKQIMKHCTIKPGEINDETIKENIQKLRNYSI